MLRWLVQEEEASFSGTKGIHPILRNLAKLSKAGIEQPFWFGVTNEAFRCYLGHAHINFEQLGLYSLSSSVRDLQKKELPEEFKNQLHRLCLDEGFLDSKFEMELLLHGGGGKNLPWEPLCEVSTQGVEGLFHGIRACWLALFQTVLFKEIQSGVSDRAKLEVTVLVRLHQEETLRGKAFSYAPRSPWDRKHLVVGFDKGSEHIAFLVDRNSLHATYYGKAMDDLEEAGKPMERTKSSEYRMLPNSDRVKKISEFLLVSEKHLESPLQLDWSLTVDQRLVIRRIKNFDRSPALPYFLPQLNSLSRNVWDQSLIAWNPSTLLKPLWFSLVPRNFRLLAIRYVNTLGIKNQLPPSYEKVFRGFWGIIRGRPYINLAAFHRFLSLGGQSEIADEMEMMVPIWMKRYDREMRDAWDSQWPEPLDLSPSAVKRAYMKQQGILKELPTEIHRWIDRMHSLRESLVSSQWKEKNISALLEALQVWERKYVPELVSILMAELQYLNLVSWYYQGAKKPSMDFAWNQKQTREPLIFEGSWLTRKAMGRKYDQMEMISQIRPKYIAMLEDVFEKLRKFFELLGQKYQHLGILERAEDVFYLTLEEMLAFDEGRASTVSWKKLIMVRREEYQDYARDPKVPEIWMTTGLVGVAALYPGVIAIKERRNPLVEMNRTSATSVELSPSPLPSPSRAIGQLDFIEDQEHQSVEKPRWPTSAVTNSVKGISIEEASEETSEALEPYDSKGLLKQNSPTKIV